MTPDELRKWAAYCRGGMTGRKPRGNMVDAAEEAADAWEKEQMARRLEYEVLAARIEELERALQLVYDWFQVEDGFKWQSETLADRAWHVSLAVDTALAKEEK